MKTFFLATLLLSFVYAAAFAADPSPPGTTLENLMLSKQHYTSSTQVRKAFNDAEKQASDSREKILIQLVGDLEVCIFQPESTTDPYKSCKLSPKKYGEYAKFAITVNRRLRVSPKKVGPAVECAIQKLQGSNDEQYGKCLAKE